MDTIPERLFGQKHNALVRGQSRDECFGVALDILGMGQHNDISRLEHIRDLDHRRAGLANGIIGKGQTVGIVAKEMHLDCHDHPFGSDHSPVQSPLRVRIALGRCNVDPGRVYLVIGPREPRVMDTGRAVKRPGLSLQSGVLFVP